MITFRQLLGALAFLAIIFACVLFCKAVNGYEPTQFYQAHWTFQPEQKAPHYLQAIINGYNFGRVARGTFYNYPVSFLNPDQIYSDSFQANQPVNKANAYPTTSN